MFDPIIDPTLGKFLLILQNKISYETVQIWKIHWKLKYSESRYRDSTVPSRKKYSDGTVPSRKKYRDGTVPSHKKYRDGTVSLPMKYHEGSV